MRHRQQHGVDRHHRFAAPHVPLQQPVHRHRPGQVGRNLRDRLLLTGRQLKGEEPANPGVDLRRDPERRRPPLVVLLLPPHGQRQLQDEQLLIDQPPPRPIEALLVIREVNLRQRPGQRPKIVGRQILVGKDLFQCRHERLDRAADDLPHLPLQQALGQRIDRQQLGDRLVLLIVERLHAGMDHLPDEPFILRLAREQQFLTEAEALAHEGLVEPDRPQMPASAADGDAQHRAAGASVSLVDVFDHAANALQLPLFKLIDFPLVAQVLVISREEEQHVAGGVQPHSFQQFRPRRPNALQELHRRGQQLGGSGRCGGIRAHN